MRLQIDQFQNHLTRKLLPCYLLHGDETLLLQECADQLRAACREQGFDNRKVFNVEGSFDWRQLITEYHSLSLFAERKLIEVRLPSGKPGAEGSTVLREIANEPVADNVLLVLTGRLERDASRSAWFKAIDEHGATVQAWPLRRRELPGWISKRLQAAGFRPTADAVALLAERVEGNLLAAVQEIEKLSLLAEPGPLSAETLLTLVTDSARFSPFDLCDRALEGDAAGAVRTLRGLRAEGVEAPLLLWALSEEFRRMLRLGKRRNEGQPMDQAVRDERMISKPHYEKTLRRLRHEGLDALLRQAADVDRCIKGMDKRDHWVALHELVVHAATLQSATVRHSA